MQARNIDFYGDKKRIPLTDQQKYDAVQALKKIESAKLFEAILQAALPPNNCHFPAHMKDQVAQLQAMVNTFAHNPVMMDHAIKSFKLYFDTEGNKHFDMLLKDNFNVANWNSGLLNQLIVALEIKVEPSPLVQATIHAGKVYWRIIKGDQVLHERASIKANKIVFTPENSWIVDWKLFREFKDSGKRHSPIKITKERFLAMFTKESEALVSSIWDDLKQLGILTPKNKLSESWRSLSNVTLTIPSIEARVPNKDKSKTYTLITQTLHTLANNPLLGEQFLGLPTERIFRAERTPKNWAGTGLIVNHKPTDIQHCSRLWDVASYTESSAHRNSADERAKHGGEILNYDHIPSSAFLEYVLEHYYANNGNRLMQVKTDIGKYKSGGYPKKASKNDPLTAIDIACNNHCNSLEKELEKIMLEVNELAFTIAIPENLHRQGKTYMVSSNIQLLRLGRNIFLEDIEIYLEKIKQSPAEYGLNDPNDLVKSVGAFRYFYHRNSKANATVVQNQTMLGRMAFPFFQRADHRAELDKLFTNQMNELMSEREGFSKRA